VSPEAKTDAITQGAASLPAWAAIMSWFLGITVEKWLAVAGILFIALQAAFLVWRWRRAVRREDERIANGDPPPPTTDNAKL
jgi:hypothetical protein